MRVVRFKGGFMIEVKKMTNSPERKELVELFPTAVPELLNDTPYNLSNLVRNFKEYLTIGSHETFVAKFEGQIVAFLMIRKADKEQSFSSILYAYVKPKFRKNNLMKCLVEKMEKSYNVHMVQCEPNTFKYWDKIGFHYIWHGIIPELNKVIFFLSKVPAHSDPSGEKTVSNYFQSPYSLG